MHAFALLSLEFEVARQRLRETFAESHVCGETQNLNSASNVGTSCCTPIGPLQHQVLRRANLQIRIEEEVSPEAYENEY